MKRKLIKTSVKTAALRKVPFVLPARETRFPMKGHIFFFVVWEVRFSIRFSTNLILQIINIRETFIIIKTFLNFLIIRQIRGKETHIFPINNKIIALY